MGGSAAEDCTVKLSLLILLRSYQLLLSPLLALGGPNARCRFHPNCSAYAIEAIRTHGIKKGASLSLRRISRCHPWGGGGLDPVPPVNAAD